MDTWLPFGRMPRQGNHLAGPGRLAGRQSSLHDGYVDTKEYLKNQKILRCDFLLKRLTQRTHQYISGDAARCVIAI